jgi:hypothetical protein
MEMAELAGGKPFVDGICKELEAPAIPLVSLGSPMLMGPFEEPLDDGENGVVWELLLLLPVLGADEFSVERHRVRIEVRTEANQASVPSSAASSSI